jgi:hypothetical protein
MFAPEAYLTDPALGNQPRADRLHAAATIEKQ